MSGPIPLGQCYRFMRRRVVVIQQWRDPFGRRMVRVRSADTEVAAEDGLAEADFLATAEPLDEPMEFPE